jgi:hypothetical protein
MASLADLTQGVRFEWRRMLFETQHQGCATGMGRQCPHAEHAPIAAIHISRKTGQPLGTTSTWCNPRDEVELVTNNKEQSNANDHG